MGFRLVPKLVTVILRFFAEFGSFGADYVTVIEDRPIQSATEMLPRTSVLLVSIPAKYTSTSRL